MKLVGTRHRGQLVPSLEILQADSTRRPILSVPLIPLHLQTLDRRLRRWHGTGTALLLQGKLQHVIDHLLGNDPFRGVPDSTDLDMQIGVSFSTDAKTCRLHLRGDTKRGRALALYLSGLPWGDMVKINHYTTNIYKSVQL